MTISFFRNVESPVAPPNRVASRSAAALRADGASAVEHVAGRTFHGRRGAICNRFSYGVDYVLIDPEREQTAPRFFSRNRTNLIAVHDRDHGGPRGEGPRFLRAVLTAHGLEDVTGGRLLLLAQPRALGHVFNPVSFWLAHDRAGRLRAVVAEVTNTFGDRLSYLCHRDDRGPIEPSDRLEALKALHVSPFQPIDGRYVFAFDIRPASISIRIDYHRPGGGLVATLVGNRTTLDARGIAAMLLRRPMGSRRVLALIHWQALRLWWKGARYRRWTEPPGRDLA